MYKRDFGILLISAFVVYYALQHEGSFQFKRHWFLKLHEEEFIPHSDGQLPTPIVADLNGDGGTEIIVAVHDAKIKVLSSRVGSKPGDSFARARVLGQVSLAPPQETELEQWAAISLAVGYLDPPPEELVKAPRKQVLVVVTANLHVHCFDHNLKLLWTKLLRGSMPSYSTVHEVAVHITPARVNNGDRGLVVVGFSMRLGDRLGSGAQDPLDEAFAYEHQAVEDTLLKAQVDTNTHTARRRLLSSLEDDQSGTSAQDAAGMGAGGERKLLAEMEDELSLFDDDDKDVLRAGVDLSRHFSYYAYEGGNGYQRWVHEGSDFHKDMDALANRLTPQHNYRLTAEEMAGRHFGEVSCREYRDSVLRSLPHKWERRTDTRLVARQFTRNRAGTGMQKDSLPDGGRGRATQAVTQDTTRVQGNAVTRAFAWLHSAAGRGGGVGERRKEIQQLLHNSGPGNALVSHLHEGIEAIHLYTGRTLCKLHLPSPGLHVDLNGDGIIDHLQAYGGHAPHHVSDVGHHRYGSCRAVATSGIPPREHLFNGSICTPRELLNVGRSRSGDAFIDVAQPVMLPTFRRRNGHLGGLAFFSNSKGDVTAFSAGGERLWQVHSGVTWGQHDPHVHSFEGVAPTLEVMSLRARTAPTAVLVGGTTKAALLSEHGHILDTLILPEPPSLPLVVTDFNGDGLNDIILVSHAGYFGFSQVRRPGGTPFGALVGTLIVVMVAVYLTQATSTRKGKKGRSTDRTD